MDKKRLMQLANEYEVDYETLFECFAHACRTLYGVVEIDKYENDEIVAFDIDINKTLKIKKIRVTRVGMKRIIKETTRNIHEFKNSEGDIPKPLTFNTAINALAQDITKMTKEEVLMRVISVRELSEKEKHKYKLQYFAIVRANRFLSESEKKYFIERTKNLKKGVSFVLA